MREWRNNVNIYEKIIVTEITNLRETSEHQDRIMLFSNFIAYSPTLKIAMAYC